MAFFDFVFVTTVRAIVGTVKPKLLKNNCNSPSPESTVEYFNSFCLTCGGHLIGTSYILTELPLRNSIIERLVADH